jgi:Tfp pilus assembly protein PilF
MAGYRKNFEVDPDALQAAEKSLTTALALDPAYAEAYVLAGHLYLLQGRNSDAKAALQMAESLGSQDPWLHLNWAAIHMVERNPEDALARYRQVAESGTTNRNAMEGALDGLVSYYRGKNLDGDADRAYRQLIAYSPDVAWHYGNYAGFLLCRLNHFDAAIEQYRIALDKMSYGLARRGLAAALYRKWAWHTNEDELDLTTGLLEEARTLWEGGPVEVFEEHCKAGNPALEQVRLAVRLTETRQRAQSEKAD